MVVVAELGGWWTFEILLPLDLIWQVMLRKSIHSDFWFENGLLGLLFDGCEVIVDVAGLDDVCDAFLEEFLDLLGHLELHFLHSLHIMVQFGHLRR